METEMKAFVHSISDTAGSALRPSEEVHGDIFHDSPSTALPVKSPFELSGVQDQNPTSVTPTFLSKMCCIEE